MYNWGVGPGIIWHKPTSQVGAFFIYATYTVDVGGIEPPTTSL